MGQQLIHKILVNRNNQNMESRFLGLPHYHIRQNLTLAKPHSHGVSLHWTKVSSVHYKWGQNETDGLVKKIRTHKTLNDNIDRSSYVSIYFISCANVTEYPTHTKSKISFTITLKCLIWKTRMFFCWNVITEII